MSAQPPRRGRGRLVPALALLGLALLGIGLFVYFGHAGRHLPGYAGHGEPIDPPLRLPNMALPLLSGGPMEAAPPKAPAYIDFEFFRRKWTFLYWGEALCPQRCRASLEITRQVRSALGPDLDRVQRVFVADGSCCDMDFLRAQQDLITLRAGSDASPLLALLSSADHTNATVADRIYLIDPSGRLLMSYAPNANPQDVLADLKHFMGSFRADAADSPPAPTGKSPGAGATPQIED